MFPQGLLPLIIDLASMTNAVNDQETFLAKEFVNDSIVALTKLEKPCEVTFQGLRSDVLDVLSQPSNAVYKAARDSRIESLQLSAGALEDSRSEHRLDKPQAAYHVLQRAQLRRRAWASPPLVGPVASTHRTPHTCMPHSG